MHNLPLEPDDVDIVRLLQIADAARLDDYKTPHARSLCDAARRRRSRTRRTRLATSVLGAVLVVAIMLASGPKPSQPDVDETVKNNAANELRRALAALDREAEQRREIVRALRHSEQLAARQTELDSLASESSATSAVVESSRSAAISLQYAKLMERESNDAEQARREYEGVANRFPGTQWATVAAASLKRLSKDSSAL